MGSAERLYPSLIHGGSSTPHLICSPIYYWHLWKNNPLSISELLLYPSRDMVSRKMVIYWRNKKCEFYFHPLSKKVSIFWWESSNRVDKKALSLFRAIIGKQMIPNENFTCFLINLGSDRKTFRTFEGFLSADLIALPCTCPERPMRKKCFAKQAKIQKKFGLSANNFNPEGRIYVIRLRNNFERRSTLLRKMQPSLTCLRRTGTFELMAFFFLARFIKTPFHVSQLGFCRKILFSENFF